MPQALPITPKGRVKCSCGCGLWLGGNGRVDYSRQPLPQPKKWGGGWASGGYGGGYDYYAVKRFKLSDDLSGRVTRFLFALTGNRYELQSGSKWETRGKVIEYNAADLEGKTDSVVFAYIIDELARALFWDWEQLVASFRADASRRQLRILMERHRARTLLMEAYGGAVEYLQEYYAVQVAECSRLLAIDTSSRGQFLLALDSVLLGQSIDALNVTDDTRQRITACQLAALGYVVGSKMSRVNGEYAEVCAQYPDEDENAPEMSQGAQNRYSVPEPQGAQNRYSVPEPQGKGTRTQGKQVKSTQRGRLSGKDDGESKKARASAPRYYEEVAKHRPRISTLAAHLRRVLQENAAERVAGQSQRGVLNVRRLWKVARQMTLKPFQRREIIDARRYAFSILIDTSGSMQGAKAWQAFSAMVLLTESLEMADVPVAVYEYGHEIARRKEYERSIEPRRLECIADADGCSTREGQALEKAIADMATLPPDVVPVLLIVTDGSPDNTATVQAQVKEFRKRYRQGKIITLAVAGMACESGRDLLDQLHGKGSAVIVEDVAALPQVFARVARRLFVKRGL